MTDLNSLFSDLVRIETRLWNLLETRLGRELDLTLGRFETMTVVGRRHRCRAQDIADELGITISGTSKLLSRIEAAGHCLRSANPEDARSSLVELTPAGRRILDRATTVVEAELAELILAALPPDTVRTLATSLAILKTSIHPADAASS